MQHTDSNRPLGAEYVVDPNDRVTASASHPHHVGRDAMNFVALTAADLPEVASATLRWFAEHQGTMVDPLWDERPGKIPHEIVECWPGGDYLGIPAPAGARIVYYGSADVTAEFVIALAVAAAAGNTQLVDDLEVAWRAAGECLLAELGVGGGLLRWARPEPYRGTGLEAQGWRDVASARLARAAGSGCILHPNGRPPRTPVADWETQAVVLVALRALWRLSGDERYRHAAILLERRIQRGFDPAALGLEWGDEADHQIPGAGSQSGVLLWAGALSGEAAEAAAHRLLQADITTRWGARMLSARSQLYRPIRTRWGRVYAYNAYLAACGLHAVARCDEADQMAQGIAAAIDELGDYPACWAVGNNDRLAGVGEGRSACAIAVRHAIRRGAWHTAAGLCEPIGRG